MQSYNVIREASFRHDDTGIWRAVMPRPIVVNAKWRWSLSTVSHISSVIWLDRLCLRSDKAHLPHEYLALHIAPHLWPLSSQVPSSPQNATTAVVFSVAVLPKTIPRLPPQTPSSFIHTLKIPAHPLAITVGWKWKIAFSAQRHVICLASFNFPRRHKRVGGT